LSNHDPEVHNGTILVADDEASVTGLLKAVLSKEGHAVHTASTGIEAIKVAGETKPDLIIMDITIPEMDGYEATEQIKRDPRFKSTPVIFLTGKSAQEDGGKAFARGGLTFVQKPFSNQQIVDLVNLTMESLKG